MQSDFLILTCDRILPKFSPHLLMYIPLGTSHAPSYIQVYTLKGREREKKDKATAYCGRSTFSRMRDSLFPPSFALIKASHRKKTGKKKKRGRKEEIVMRSENLENVGNYSVNCRMNFPLNKFINTICDLISIKLY